jgi:hypothetical protein
VGTLQDEELPVAGADDLVAVRDATEQNVLSA